MLKSKRKKITVIGGANLDICGKAIHQFNSADSNVGTVTFSHGGVGRNIVHNLALLGCNVSFISAVGSDVFSKVILDDLSKLGVDVSKCGQMKDQTISTYLFVCDDKGDTVAAINDMAVCDQLTVDFLKKRKAYINSSAAVVFDTNIPAESIQWIFDNVTIPIIVEPVSVTKAKKLPDSLTGVAIIKPNLAEAELLSGMKIKTPEDQITAAKLIVNKGAQRVYMSLGKDGVLCCDADSVIHIDSYNCNVVNTSGAGDAFASGITKAFLSGKSLEEAGKYGVAAASIACESITAVNQELSDRKVCERL